MFLQHRSRTRFKGTQPHCRAGSDGELTELFLHVCHAALKYGKLFVLLGDLYGSSMGLVELPAPARPSPVEGGGHMTLSGQFE